MDESGESEQSRLINDPALKQAGIDTPKRISRKKFLTTAFLVAGGALSAWILRNTVGDRLISPEKEREPKTLVLDIFDTKRLREKLIQDNFSVGFSEENTLKGMGVEDTSNEEGLAHGTPENDEQAKLLLLRFLELQFKDHGQDVVDVMDKTNSYISGKTERIARTQISIIDAFKVQGIDYDELGNPILKYFISADVIDKLLSNSDEDLVNMSFQLGENEVKFVMYEKVARFPVVIHASSVEDENGNFIPLSEPTYQDRQGNVITKEEYDKLYTQAQQTPINLLPPKARYFVSQDGYYGENTYDNLKALAGVAEKHPEKVFIAAGGNLLDIGKYPDIKGARAELEKDGSWPDNLFMAGYEMISGWMRTPASFGSDIYIDGNLIEKNFGKRQSSSFATAITFAILAQKVKAKEGEFAIKVNDLFDNFGLERTAGIGNKELKYDLLDIQSIKQDN